MPTTQQSTDCELNEFANSLIRAGVDITRYDENDRMYLLKVARLCAKQAGLPLGAAIGAASAGVGSVTLPLVGAVPGYVAGFLAGAIGGTAACTISRMSMKESLDSILRNTPQPVKNMMVETP